MTGPQGLVWFVDKSSLASHLTEHFSIQTSNNQIRESVEAILTLVKEERWKRCREVRLATLRAQMAIRELKAAKRRRQEAYLQVGRVMEQFDRAFNPRLHRDQLPVAPPRCKALHYLFDTKI